MASRAPAAKQRRRLEIIAVSTRLLEEKGYGRTTMDDIAAAARVTKRTLYRYVPTKQDILPMIHERFLQAADDRFLVNEQAGDPARRIADFIDSYVAVVVENQGAVRVFFEEEYNLTPYARTRIVARRDAFEERVRDIIRAGKASGTFRDCEVEVVSAGILGALASIYRWYSPVGKLGIRDLSILMSRLLLTGLTEAKRRAARDTPEGRPRTARVEPEVPQPTTVPETVRTAAVKLFATQGYLETNTREIAEAAGITQSGLFYHVGAKEELLYSLQHRFITDSLGSLARWTAEAAPPDDVAHRLRVLIVEHAKLAAARPYEVRVFTDQFRYVTGTRRAGIEALSARYLDGFEDVVRRGIALGVFQDLHPRVTALTVLGVLNSMLRWYRPEGRLSAEQIGEVFADLLLRGLFVRDDAPR